ADDRHPVRPCPADLVAKQPRDGGGDQRREDDRDVDVLHAQPFSLSSSSTLMLRVLRNSTTRIARPIAASAAATVRMKNTNTWPSVSFHMRENAMKLKFTASSMSSIHIKSRITFLRLMKMPATARLNSTAASAR